MREIFITDIHSQYSKFKTLLNKANYERDKDLLILGGDYFDRGKESNKMAKWLEDNYDKPNVVLIRGNHDLALMKLLNGCDSTVIQDYLEIQHMVKVNGLDTTLDGLIGGDHRLYTHSTIAEIINREYPKLLDALNSTKFYHETDSAIYTHAYLPFNYKTVFEQIWNKYLWENSYKWANSIMWTKQTEITKPVIIGHYALPNIDDWDKENPVVINGIVFADGGLGWGYDGVVNIID